MNEISPSVAISASPKKAAALRRWLMLHRGWILTALVAGLIVALPFGGFVAFALSTATLVWVVICDESTVCNHRPTFSWQLFLWTGVKMTLGSFWVLFTLALLISQLLPPEGWLGRAVTGLTGRLPQQEAYKATMAQLAFWTFSGFYFTTAMIIAARPHNVRARYAMPTVLLCVFLPYFGYCLFAAQAAVERREATSKLQIAAALVTLAWLSGWLADRWRERREARTAATIAASSGSAAA